MQGLSRLAAKRGRNGGPSQVYFSQLTFSEGGGTPLPARSEAFRSLLETTDRQIDDLAQHYRNRYLRLNYTPSTWPGRGNSEGSLRFHTEPVRPRESHGFMGASTFPLVPAGLVMASADGVVHSTSWRSDYGKTIILKHHFGLSTVYAQPLRIQRETG